MSTVLQWRVRAGWMRLRSSGCAALRSFRAAAAQLLTALLAHMLQGLHGRALDPAALQSPGELSSLQLQKAWDLKWERL